jgi:hypothetical protein
LTLAIVPFSADHLEAAAALLATRHGADRTWAPELSPQYEDAAAACAVLQHLLSDEAVTGVAAILGGTLGGFLLGAPELRAPTDTFAGI